MFSFDSNKNLISNCRQNAYYVIVDQGKPIFSHSREQFTLIALPEEEEVEFDPSNDQEGYGWLINENNLYPCLSNETEKWVQIEKANKDLEKVKEFLPSQIKIAKPEDKYHLIDGEMYNLPSMAQSFVDSNIVNKIMLNTYINSL